MTTVWKASVIRTLDREEERQVLYTSQPPRAPAAAQLVQSQLNIHNLLLNIRIQCNLRAFGRSSRIWIRIHFLLLLLFFKQLFPELARE